MDPGIKLLLFVLVGAAVVGAVIWLFRKVVGIPSASSHGPGDPFGGLPPGGDTHGLNGPDSN